MNSIYVGLEHITMPNFSNPQWLDQTRGLHPSSRVLSRAGIYNFGRPVFAEDLLESNPWCGNTDGLSTCTSRLLYIGREASQCRCLSSRGPQLLLLAGCIRHCNSTLQSQFIPGSVLHVIVFVLPPHAYCRLSSTTEHCTMLLGVACI